MTLQEARQATDAAMLKEAGGVERLELFRDPKQRGVFSFFDAERAVADAEIARLRAALNCEECGGCGTVPEEEGAGIPTIHLSCPVCGPIRESVRNKK